MAELNTETTLTATATEEAKVSVAGEAGLLQHATITKGEESKHEATTTPTTTTAADSKLLPQRTAKDKEDYEVAGGYEDDLGFYMLPDGSFYDPDGYYFAADGYDEYGGYYNDKN